MESAMKRRIVCGAGWVVATVCAVGAAVTFLGYMAQGIVVGSLTGLPGREHDVAMAQARAGQWLGLSWLWQAGVVLGLVAAFKIGEDSAAIKRYATRFLAAAALSFPFSFLLGTVLMEIARLLFHRSM
jgi:hypothetical protein